MAEKYHMAMRQGKSFLSTVPVHLMLLVLKKAKLTWDSNCRPLPSASLEEALGMRYCFHNYRHTLIENVALVCLGPVIALPTGGPLQHLVPQEVHEPSATGCIGHPPDPIDVGAVENVQNDELSEVVGLEVHPANPCANVHSRMAGIAANLPVTAATSLPDSLRLLVVAQSVAIVPPGSPDLHQYSTSG